MNNEPVAWIIDVKMTDCDDNFIWNTGDYPDWQVKDWIPLYTHPVKELTAQEVMEQTHKKISEAHWKVKELTDEEIISTMVQFDVYSSDDHCLIEAGRAILRKAQDGHKN